MKLLLRYGALIELREIGFIQSVPLLLAKKWSALAKKEAFRKALLEAPIFIDRRERIGDEILILRIEPIKLVGRDWSFYIGDTPMIAALVSAPLMMSLGYVGSEHFDTILIFIGKMKTWSLVGGLCVALGAGYYYVRRKRLAAEAGAVEVTPE